MTTVMFRLIQEDEGQDLIEYGLLAAFISLAAVIAITSVGTALGTTYTSLSGQITAAS